MQNVVKTDSESYRDRGDALAVHPEFLDFVERELLPAAGLDAESFWPGLASLLTDLGPRNRELLDKRDRLQAQIDDWHRANAGQPWDHAAYVGFLKDIAYLEETGEPFTISTRDVDPEIAEVAGPQLVVPVSNARFALNAANARWGSLYDALYGTDVIDERDGRERGSGYNPDRGVAVIAYVATFLDRAIPLAQGSHAGVSAYEVVNTGERAELRVRLGSGAETGLAEPDQFKAYSIHGRRSELLFCQHGLHIELRIDPEHPVGRNARAHVCDVVLEAALTTIQDCEDSVAAVDAGDKVGVYRNWLGLMRGDLEAGFDKGGRAMTRTLAPDRSYTAVDGGSCVLPGRSLMLVRNVGLLMTTDAVLDREGNEVFEGLLDAVVTTACAMANAGQERCLPNSRSHSVYIVKPKLHGPEEAAFTQTLFARVEALLGLETNTIKIGIMDEERRTTVNLQECIRAVRERLVFINTGFLDRTGDEIHTSMQGGAVLPKESIKVQPWIRAYEDWNVDIGLRCGLPGRAQIGKGMWAKPDEMKQMMDSKQAQVEAGASCAWVPSPTAATLHAMHYHAVNVRERQRKLADRPVAKLDDILSPPFADPEMFTADEVQRELENNAQGILGYVVRWIDQGIGCSKVPDIENVALMEDRATLRISSQHMANWLLHGVCSEEQVLETMKRMARVVDEQNAADPAYQAMSADFEASIAFQAACDLVFKGCEQPNGYTEPLLHKRRRQKKGEA